MTAERREWGKRGWTGMRPCSHVSRVREQNSHDASTPFAANSVLLVYASA